MAQDELLAQRVREAVLDEPDISERKMFGGIAFKAGDNMFVAVSSRGLLARVGPEEHADALQQPGVSPMIMGGRSMTGYVSVSREVLATDEELRRWLAKCLAFVRSLPAKKTPARKNARRRA